MAVQDCSRGYMLLQNSHHLRTLLSIVQIQVPPVQDTFNDDDTATRSCLEQYQLSAAERQEESEVTRNSHGLSPGEFAPPGVVISLLFNATIPVYCESCSSSSSTCWAHSMDSEDSYCRSKLILPKPPQPMRRKTKIPEQQYLIPLCQPRHLNTTADSQVKEDEAQPDEPMTAAPPVVNDASQVKDEPMPESTAAAASSIGLVRPVTRTTTTIQNHLPLVSVEYVTGGRYLDSRCSRPFSPTTPSTTQTHTIATPRDDNAYLRQLNPCRHSQRSRSK